MTPIFFLGGVELPHPLIMFSHMRLHLSDDLLGDIARCILRFFIFLLLPDLVGVFSWSWRVEVAPRGFAAPSSQRYGHASGLRGSCSMPLVQR